MGQAGFSTSTLEYFKPVPTVLARSVAWGAKFELKIHMVPEG